MILAERFRGLGLAGVLFLCAGCGGSNDTAAGPTFKQQFEQAEQIADPEARARRLLKLAVEQHKGQDSSGAKQTLAAAVRACAGVKLPAPRCAIYTELAGAQAALGNKLEAGEALKTAEQAAAEIASPEEHARVLCAIATIHGQKLNSKNDASDALDAAETLLDQIADPLGRTLVQVAIVKACAAAELKKQGERVLVTGLAEAKEQSDPALRADAFTQLAGGQLAMGQADAALETLDAAIASTTEIERVYKRIHTLTDIASALNRAGDKAQAQKLLAQAEALVAKVPEPDLQTQAREHVRGRMEKMR